MSQTATITSKRQLNLKKGDRVLLHEQNGVLTLRPAVDHLKKLAGSVQVPSNLHGADADEAISQSKKLISIIKIM